MQLNADFGVRVVLRPADLKWTPSPMPGVERKMLDRIGEEVARATSIVRYAPNSRFSEHTHGGGEEFLVLEGVFADEQGEYPAGTYVRNPIGSSHAPRSDDGCTLFVKLRQFSAGDATRKVMDTRSARFQAGPTRGISVLPLHEFGSERVALERWERQSMRSRHRHPGGLEVLVLEGIFQDEYGSYPVGTWLRYPAASEHASCSSSGCLVYAKTGHLAQRGATSTS